jgi:hypothetical protein
VIGRLAKILEEAVSETGGQISRISLKRRPETGLKGTEHGSIPSTLPIVTNATFCRTVLPLGNTPILA